MKTLKLAFVSALFIPFLAFAQSGQTTLPSAGLTPDSFFYFLDQWGEDVQQFFTFNQEAKAKLQIEFAGERIAEIKAIVENKGPDAKGIDIAKGLLLANVAHAAEIVDQEKASGKDVSALAKDIGDQFDAREKLLTQTFLDARAKLIAQHKEIKEKLLKDAQAAGDTAKIAELTQQLNDIENQANDLKDKKDEIKASFRDEKKKIEENMNKEDRQQDEKDRNNEDQIEQNQDGGQGEFELEQEGGQRDSEKEQGGEHGKAEENQKGDQGENKVKQGGQQGVTTNQSGNHGEQENGSAGAQGTSTQERE